MKTAIIFLVVIATLNSSSASTAPESARLVRVGNRMAFEFQGTPEYTYWVTRQDRLGHLESTHLQFFSTGQPQLVILPNLPGSTCFVRLLKGDPVKKNDGNREPSLIYSRIPQSFQQIDSGIEISFQIRIRVNVDGTVNVLEIRESSHPDLNREVTEAVEDWRYIPAITAGEYIDFEAVQPILRPAR